MIVAPRDIEIRHFHLFCGLGGGARGFNRGTARVGHARATFRCLGGVDNDKAAIADFNRLAGVRGTVLDMFNREQYVAFHGHEPSAEWREATPADVQAAAGFERPHIGFGSAPRPRSLARTPERPLRSRILGRSTRATVRRSTRRRASTASCPGTRAAAPSRPPLATTTAAGQWPTLGSN